jgi:hypothetical protein
LAVAFTSPVSVVTVIVLLSMPSGLRRAIAFLCGWLVALAGIGLLVVFVLHGQDSARGIRLPRALLLLSRSSSGRSCLSGRSLLFGGVGLRQEACRRRDGLTVSSAPTGSSPSLSARSC